MRHHVIETSGMNNCDICPQKNLSFSAMKPVQLALIAQYLFISSKRVNLLCLLKSMLENRMSFKVHMFNGRFFPSFFSLVQNT